MFEPSPTPRLYAMPPGAAFPEALVRGLRERMRGQPPEAMGRITLFVNSSRMLRAVRAAFDAGGPAVLPRLRMVGDLGSDPSPGIPPAVPPLRRRFELMRLVDALTRLEPDFAAGIGAFNLADSLAALLDEMQREGIAAQALDTPELASDHAAHWERSLRFLRIVLDYLDAESAPDAEARQRMVIDAMTARWSLSAPDAPIIIAGSTGSRGTTVRLMQAVAGLPQGAVVLPGFDFDLPQPVWDTLQTSVPPPEDHPQFRFASLLARLGMQPHEVLRWVEEEAPVPSRNRLLSLALRPAPVTDGWMREGSGLDGLESATEGLTLVEAPSERDEALAIAVRLRKSVEDGQKAALITPDRILARRVTAALDRWRIVPDDSGGEPLGLSAPGRFLRHAASLFGERVTASDLLILLKHPITATGAGDRGTHLRFTRDLELHLRRYGPAFPTGKDLQAWAKRRRDEALAAWTGWLSGLLSELEESGELPLSERVSRHLGLAQRFAAGSGGRVEDSQLWQDAAGSEALAVMRSLEAEASHACSMTAFAYNQLVADLLAREGARSPAGANPLVAIWGTLEARIQGAEVVVLAGLNEGVWPQPAATDPWLSRQMRLRAGLPLPERRIGLSAHDFQQAAAARVVVLSRSLRDAQAETVPSRWLARLLNLLSGLPGERGKPLVHDMRARGQELLRVGRGLDPAPETPSPARRPAPIPPVSARPRELPVTAIRRLMLDPYSIYVRYVLRLRPLDPLRPVADARHRGEILHKIVETFVRERPAAETEGEALSRLTATAQRVLDENVPWPVSRRIWLQRILKIGETFVRRELGRAQRGQPVLIEKPGRVEVLGGVVLTARPDRIDRNSDGSLHIYDYKSGRFPAVKDVGKTELQLPLEAAMAERGAFPDVGAAPVSGATYVQLGGDNEEREVDTGPEALEKAWGILTDLISLYEHPDTPYKARRMASDKDNSDDYAPVSRFGEWSLAEPPEETRVGP